MRAIGEKSGTLHGSCLTYRAIMCLSQFRLARERDSRAGAACVRCTTACASRRGFPCRAGAVLPRVTRPRSPTGARARGRRFVRFRFCLAQRARGPNRPSCSVPAAEATQRPAKQGHSVAAARQRGDLLAAASVPIAPAAGASASSHTSQRAHTCPPRLGQPTACTRSSRDAGPAGCVATRKDLGNAVGPPRPALHSRLPGLAGTGRRDRVCWVSLCPRLSLF